MNNGYIIKSVPSEVSYLSPILVLGLHTSLVFQQSLKTNYRLQPNKYGTFDKILNCTVSDTRSGV